MNHIAESIDVEITSRPRANYYAGRYGGGIAQSMGDVCHDVVIRLHGANPEFVDKLMAYMRAQGAEVQDVPMPHPRRNPSRDVDRFAYNENVAKLLGGFAAPLPENSPPQLGTGGVSFEDDDGDDDQR
jgi:hypothetical protein